MSSSGAHHVVLVSGGIDSATALTGLVRDGHAVSALFLDYAQPAVRSEHAAAVRVCGSLGVGLRREALPAMLADPEGMYCGRNALFVLIAAAVVPQRPLVVTLGLQRGPPWYDATPTFVADVQRILDGYSSGTVQLSAPFAGMDKRAVLQLAQRFGVSVAETYSCQRQEAPPCGRCPSCLDREVLGV